MGGRSALTVGMAHSGFSNVLKNGGFQAFLWTQFLGAFNDSVYQTIVGLHVYNVNPAYVPLVPAVFTLPSLLFSGYSGHLADLVSKRRVLIGVKLFEIAIMLFGLTTLLAGWTEGMLLVVFLMGLHATIFSPAKYGIVPEMLGDRDLSRGNAPSSSVSPAAACSSRCGKRSPGASAPPRSSSP
jgi:acyl-[acyl-carrier-protein]-phospholipid O-acyltransferase/long-chain-fatty-acid--[acyl-carrier-protein] ligase